MTRACLGLLAGMYALQLNSFEVGSDHVGTAFIIGIVLLVARQFRILAWYCTGAALFLLAAEDVINSRVDEDLVGDSLVIDIEIDSFPSRSGAAVSRVDRLIVSHADSEAGRAIWPIVPVRQSPR